MVFLPMNNANIKARYDAFRNVLLQDVTLVDVTASSSPPFWGLDIGTQDINWEGKDPGEDFLIRGVGVDYNFIETFKIEMAEGRNFSPVLLFSICLLISLWRMRTFRFSKSEFF